LNSVSPALAARDAAQEFVGGAARLVGAFGGQLFRLADLLGAVAAQAGPDLRQADDVRPVSFQRGFDQPAGLDDVLRLVAARVHLHDGHAHLRPHDRWCRQQS